MHWVNVGDCNCCLFIFFADLFALLVQVDMVLVGLVEALNPDRADYEETWLLGVIDGELVGLRDGVWQAVLANVELEVAQVLPLVALLLSDHDVAPLVLNLGL